MISDATKTTDIQKDIVTTVDMGDFSPDTSGFLSGGSCPQIPDIVVFGTSYALDPNGRLCSILDWVRALVMLAAYYAAFKIISR